jgi:hypothetical protein
MIIYRKKIEIMVELFYYCIIKETNKILNMNNKIIKSEYDHRTEYTLNGNLHRIDGPAVILSNGTKYWFINGKQLSENEFNQYILKHNLEKI